MAFYRDSDGAIWQDGWSEVLYCIADPEDGDDTMIGIPMDPSEVGDTFGPLVKVRPIGWEEV